MQSFLLKSAIVLTALGAVATACGPANAQTYPDKPVKIVIGFGPGSGTDIIARFIAKELQQRLGQPFVVENQPGAAAQIAATNVAQAAPDGYTLLLTSNSSHSVNPHMIASLPYDPIKDFTPIGGIAYFPFLLAVNPQVQATTPEEFVAWAKAQDGGANYAYGTNAVQIPSAALNNLLDLGATGVAYKSSPEAMTDVINGSADFIVTDFASSRGHIAEGRLRPIAVTMGERTKLAPDLPTIRESLHLEGFDLAAWTGLFGPAGLPQGVVDTISAAMQETLKDPAVQQRIIDMGAEPTPSDPAAFGELVRKQLDLWGQKVRDAGLTAQ